MNYQDWPVESTAFIGRLDGLVPVPILKEASVKESEDANWSFQTTVSGAVHAQRTPLSRRKWDVELAELPPSMLNSLRSIAMGGYGPGPFAWVAPHMQGTNLVTPDDSLMSKITGSANQYTAGGPMVLDGQWVPQSRVCANGWAQSALAVHEFVPVNPTGGQITASVWIKGAGMMVWRWLMPGGVTRTDPSGTWSLPAGSWWTYQSLSATPPAGAIAAQLVTYNCTGIAGVQVVWGNKAPTNYFPGEGCQKAVLSPVPRTFGAADADGLWAKASFTVTEVG